MEPPCGDGVSQCFAAKLTEPEVEKRTRDAERGDDIGHFDVGGGMGVDEGLGTGDECGGG